VNETIEDLKLLNRQTFDAEAQKQIGGAGEHWRDFLQVLLAANFSIRRANGVTQNKAEMIEFIQGGVPVERVLSEGYQV
jgi:hypothetical protein